jgi:hypothetical protein
MTSGTIFSKCRVSGRIICRLFMAFLITIMVSRVASAGKQSTWIELRSPNFIVVTNGDEGQAWRTAYQFEMFRAVYIALFRDNSGQTTTTLGAC